MPKFLKKILPIVIIAVIFLFLGKNLVENWSSIPFDQLRFNAVLLVISFIALVAHFLSYAKSWQELMRALGSSISFAQSTWMIATTQIAKYVPGRIWYMVGRVYVGKKEKIQSESLAVSMVLETCLLLITSSIIFLISSMLSGTCKVGNILASLILLIIAIIIINPRVLNWITNFVLRILKRPGVKITPSYTQMLKLSIYYFGLWIAQIVGLYFLVNSIYQFPISSIFTLAGAHTLSWIIGFVVLFAPSGLGVREGVMTVLLSSILPTPLAIAVSFISRIWMTVFEIVVFFVGLLVKKMSARSG